MYVVRPTSFLSFINILKDTLKKNKELIDKINDYKNPYIDREIFENNLHNFKLNVQKSASLGSKAFVDAIKNINNAISDLEKTRDSLTKANHRMQIACNKVLDINYKKLVKGCKNDPFSKLNT